MKVSSFTSLLDLFEDSLCGSSDFNEEVSDLYFWESCSSDSDCLEIASKKDSWDWKLSSLSLFFFFEVVRLFTFKLSLDL